MASGCLFVSLTVLLIVIFVLLMALTHLAGTTVIAPGYEGMLDAEDYETLLERDMLR